MKSAGADPQLAMSGDWGGEYYYKYNIETSFFTSTVAHKAILWHTIFR